MTAIMMLCSLFVIASAAEPVDQLWEDWKKAHGRSYTTIQEEQKRHSIFTAQKLNVDRLNNETNSAEFALTKFADYTDEEFDVLNGYLKETDAKLPTLPTWQPKNRQHRLKYVAQSLDWRKTQGVITPIKNQGVCGSCWAFSAAAVVESAMSLKGYPEELLSTQMLAGYSTYDNGCGGGGLIGPFKWISEQENGLAADAWCPYVQSMARDEGLCLDPLCTKGCRNLQDKYALGPQSISAGYPGRVNFTAVKYAIEPCNNKLRCDNQDFEGLKLALREYGPLNIAVDATNWRYYDGGIFTERQCSKGRNPGDEERGNGVSFLNHAVVLVGYYEDFDNPKNSYWLVRNSWGTDFGENGYIRLEYGTNACGMDDEPVAIEVL